MNRDTWLDPLRKIVRPLLSSGDFRVTYECADAQAFGNALIVLDSPRIRLRFVVDRADLFGAIASSAAPREWFDLKSVIKALGYFAGELGPWEHPDKRFRPDVLPTEPVDLVLRHRDLLEAAADNKFQIVGGQVQRVYDHLE